MSSPKRTQHVLWLEYGACLVPKPGLKEAPRRDPPEVPKLPQRGFPNWGPISKEPPKVRRINSTLVRKRSPKRDPKTDPDSGPEAHPKSALAREWRAVGSEIGLGKGARKVTPEGSQKDARVKIRETRRAEVGTPSLEFEIAKPIELDRF